MNVLMRIWFVTFLVMCVFGYLMNQVQPITTLSKKTSASTNTDSFTVMGVGDNLLHDVIFRNMDQSMKDVDYNDFYKTIKNNIQMQPCCY